MKFSNIAATLSFVTFCVASQDVSGKDDKRQLLAGLQGKDALVARAESDITEDSSPVETAPIESPIDPPAESPVESPIESPVESPIESPVESPIEAPVESPVEAPVESPVETPVESPIESPLPKVPSPTPTESETRSPIILHPEELVTCDPTGLTTVTTILTNVHTICNEDSCGYDSWYEIVSYTSYLYDPKCTGDEGCELTATTWSVLVTEGCLSLPGCEETVIIEQIPSVGEDGLTTFVDSPVTSTFCASPAPCTPTTTYSLYSTLVCAGEVISEPEPAPETGECSKTRTTITSLYTHSSECPVFTGCPVSTRIDEISTTDEFGHPTTVETTVYITACPAPSECVPATFTETITIVTDIGGENCPPENIPKGCTTSVVTTSSTSYVLDCDDSDQLSCSETTYVTTISISGALYFRPIDPTTITTTVCATDRKGCTSSPTVIPYTYTTVVGDDCVPGKDTPDTPGKETPDTPGKETPDTPDKPGNETPDTPDKPGKETPDTPDKPAKPTPVNPKPSPDTPSVPENELEGSAPSLGYFQGGAILAFSIFIVLLL
ncbi:uncharacterized protein RJT20DRAFT_153080 [Scheffersomyces xylosifermentans]|uniref:uncharacterized protein n=1 Tax=Scheffersomyces xylosifermentans TaxID=1304137 RepID=UPI00315D8565